MAKEQAAALMDAQRPSAAKDGSGLSVERVFLILERLAEHGKPMTLTELSVALNLPKSSLLKLLRGLTSLGYVDEDLQSKSYFPSLKVCTLGKQVEDLLIGHSGHIAMLEEIRDATGESVSLAVQHGVHAQFHNGLHGHHQITFNISDGLRFPIHVAAAGRVLLSVMPEADLDKLAARIRRSGVYPDTPIDLKSLKAELRRIRERGYATSDKRVTANVMSIGILLPRPDSVKPVALSVGGPKSRISKNEKDIVAAVKNVFAGYYA
ncbi:MAG: IclR family transcriptional regulator C-terminal domain-containing protein [Pseudomonadota bacterium]